MNDHTPSAEALKAAMAAVPKLRRFQADHSDDRWVYVVALALDDTAAAQLRCGYDLAIEKLRKHNRKLYGVAPQHLADWLNADNVRPPEVR